MRNGQMDDIMNIFLILSWISTISIALLIIVSCLRIIGIWDGGPFLFRTKKLKSGEIDYSRDSANIYLEGFVVIPLVVILFLSILSFIVCGFIF